MADNLNHIMKYVDNSDSSYMSLINNGMKNKLENSLLERIKPFLNEDGSINESKYNEEVITLKTQAEDSKLSQIKRDLFDSRLIALREARTLYLRKTDKN